MFIIIRSHVVANRLQMVTPIAEILAGVLAEINPMREMDDPPARVEYIVKPDGHHYQIIRRHRCGRVDTYSEACAFVAEHTGPMGLHGTYEIAFE